jgi:hypothetical protein
MMDRNDLQARAREILADAWEPRNADAARALRRGMIDDTGIDALWAGVALRAIEAAIRQSAWRPMSEAPRDGTPILGVWVMRPNGPPVDWGVTRWSHGDWCDDESGLDIPTPTAWMPLPPPPTGEVGT